MVWMFCFISCPWISPDTHVIRRVCRAILEVAGHVSGEVTKRFADVAAEPALLFEWPADLAIMYCCIDRKLFWGMLDLKVLLELVTSLSCASVSTIQALPIALDII